MQDARHPRRTPGTAPASPAGLTLKAARRLARLALAQPGSRSDDLLALADRFAAAAQEARLAATAATAGDTTALASGLDALAGTLREVAPVYAEAVAA